MGGSIDPETGVVYVGSSRGILGMSLVPSGDRSDVGYISGRAPGAQGALTVKGLPLVKPPYSQISALDLKTGKILWQTPHGDTPDNVRNNPALIGLTIPRTGHGGAAITLVTKTLVIAGEKGTVTLPDGRVGADASRLQRRHRAGCRHGFIWPAPSHRRSHDLHGERRPIHHQSWLAATLTDDPRRNSWRSVCHPRPRLASETVFGRIHALGGGEANLMQ